MSCQMSLFAEQTNSLSTKNEAVLTSFYNNFYNFYKRCLKRGRLGVVSPTLAFLLLSKAL